MPNQQAKPLPGCFPSGGGCLALGGFGLAGFFSLALIGWATDKEATPIEPFIFSLFMLLIGLVLVFFGFRQRKSVKQIRTVIDIVQNQGHRSLDQIAALMPEIPDSEKATLEVQKAINKGYLPGFRIDVQARRVVKAGERPAPDAKPRMVAFKCQSCGAANQMSSDKPLICGYCGSPHAG